MGCYISWLFLFLFTPSRTANTTAPTPNTTLSPSSEPSSAPSAIPTTMIPSYFPTAQPTEVPVVIPTNSPIAVAIDGNPNEMDSALCSQWKVPMAVSLDSLDITGDAVGKIETAMFTAFFLSIFYGDDSWGEGWCLENTFNLNTVFIHNGGRRLLAASTADAEVEAFYTVNDALKTTFFDVASFNDTAFTLLFQEVLRNAFGDDVDAVSVPTFSGLFDLYSTTTTTTESADSDSTDGPDAETAETTANASVGIQSLGAVPFWVWIIVGSLVCGGCFCVCVQIMVLSIEKQEKRYQEALKHLEAASSATKSEDVVHDDAAHGVVNGDVGGAADVDVVDIVDIAVDGARGVGVGVDGTVHGEALDDESRPEPRSTLIVHPKGTANPVVPRRASQCQTSSRGIGIGQFPGIKVVDQPVCVRSNDLQSEEQKHSEPLGTD